VLDQSKDLLVVPGRGVASLGQLLGRLTNVRFVPTEPALASHPHGIGDTRDGIMLISRLLGMQRSQDVLPDPLLQVAVSPREQSGGGGIDRSLGRGKVAEYRQVVPALPIRARNLRHERGCVRA
jgi:hypothetical protein